MGAQGPKSWKSQQRRADEVKARAANPNHMYGYCRVIGCGRPARAGTEDGLDERYCRAHAEHHQRHGSPFKGSYPAKVLNPYRRAALAWLTQHEADSWVKNAIQRVQGLYRRGGEHVEAFRLRGLPPRERANAHWARLRKSAVDPRLVIAAWLAVEMVIGEDPQPVLTSEFKRVQAAKVVHRMASGSHKRWELPVSVPGRGSSSAAKVHVQEMHVYPRSRGRVLRHIGQDLETAVEFIVSKHLDEIRAFKQNMSLKGSYGDRPFPKGWAARKRGKPKG